MRKTLITLGIILLIVIVIYSWFKGAYNGLVVKSNDTKAKWAIVDLQYQRRLNLYNSIIDNIQSSGNFEKSTLKAVIDARAQATSIKVDASNLSPDQIQKFESAQNNMRGSLLAVFEKYPELKTTDAYRDFQSQMEGTEDRIAKARKDYDLSVQDYNTSIESFPVNLYAKSFGFTERGYFKSQPGADTNIPTFNKENTPEVKQ